MKKKMDGVLTPAIIRILRKVGRMANSSECSAFMVGGMVRDLVLGVKNLDLDIVIEGDAIGIGKILADALGATLVVHRRFGTCSVVTKDRVRIDLATARKESYQRPAAFPTVEFSSLKDDLMRRDFTINTMAISLNKSDFGKLIDLFGARDDLLKKNIRVMHDASFIDDPTRIFRAIRLEQRFGFRIDRHTEKLMKEAIGRGIMREDEPMKALERLGDFIHARHLIKKVCG